MHAAAMARGGGTFLRRGLFACAFPEPAHAGAPEPCAARGALVRTARLPLAAARRLYPPRALRRAGRAGRPPSGGGSFPTHRRRMLQAQQSTAISSIKKPCFTVCPACNLWQAHHSATVRGVHPPCPRFSAALRPGFIGCVYRRQGVAGTGLPIRAVTKLASIDGLLILLLFAQSVGLCTKSAVRVQPIGTTFGLSTLTNGDAMV